MKSIQIAMCIVSVLIVSTAHDRLGRLGVGRDNGCLHIAIEHAARICVNVDISFLELHFVGVYSLEADQVRCSQQS